jgi:hypothetical protein
MIQFIEKHFKYLAAGVGILVLVLAGQSWIQEHDSRLLAEQTVKQADAHVLDLEIQAKNLEAASKQKLAALRRQASQVQTPVQAIAAIPTVTDAPLNSRALPDAPSSVQVEAVPLFKELSKCRSQSVELDTCAQKAEISAQVIKERESEIDVLKHPKGFWKRFGTTLKDVGIGVAIGYGLNAASRR